MSSSSDVYLEAFPAQAKFVDAVFSGKYRYMLLGGSIRAGKTIIILTVIVTLCRIFAGSRWAVIRADLPTLKRNTIPTFFKYCCPPSFGYNYNRTDYVVRFGNGSEIMFMSEAYDVDPDHDRFKGLEVNGFVLEQVEELQESTLWICVQRTGQWKIDPMPPGLILANCNPTQKWPKITWYDPWEAKTLKAPWYFQPASIEDNPYLTQEYLDSLEELPVEIRDRYVRALWDATDEINQLTPWGDIRACSATVVDPDEGFYLGADVGRMGPDPTVLVLGKGPNIVGIDDYDKTRTTEVTEAIQNRMAQYSISADRVCVDAVGLGAGVVDELYKEGLYVIPFVGGESAKGIVIGTHFQFYNKRSWSCWVASTQLKKRNIGNFTHRTLVSDAGAIRYFIRKDKTIYIESKDDFKKRTGRSSDYWDAFVYAQWARLHDKVLPPPLLVTSAERARRKHPEAAEDEALQIAFSGSRIRGRG